MPTPQGKGPQRKGPPEEGTPRSTIPAGRNPKPSGTTATWPSSSRSCASPAWASRCFSASSSRSRSAPASTDWTRRNADLYLVTLLLAALATALLSAPVAYHRLVFRRHLKGQLLRAANVMALLGLAAVGLAISAAVLLVVGFVEHGPVVPAVAAVTVAVFIGLWFVFPMSRRHRPGE